MNGKPDEGCLCIVADWNVPDSETTEQIRDLMTADRVSLYKVFKPCGVVIFTDITSTTIVIPDVNLHLFTIYTDCDILLV